MVQQHGFTLTPWFHLRRLLTESPEREKRRQELVAQKPAFTVGCLLLLPPPPLYVKTPLAVYALASA